MNDRRNFLKSTAAAASIMALNSVPRAFAENLPMYTNIIHTKSNPGIWAQKAHLHVPEVTVLQDKINVVTKHPMSDGHFIVRHTLVLEDGTYIGSATFSLADKPESSYELPDKYKGKVYATGFCNLHDFWLTETMI
ncbi:MAG: desulfoferrodoxin [Proteobacteria bacterium]|nr:desulfoferrodoxin [Pseudomonadota bacterium]MBU1582784.1 desulfoferrodoxin [Pseudomonadota bacterium]MBU2455733.1 desulfoferrodoxin [Pseudomonadota bacterium]MBU2631903.1 desulfoferrodoxin [Pseudomonadota bacterium]